MSSHFNYEIDEKALRQKMLNQKVALDNDAWQRYESHRNQIPKNNTIETAFKTIKFSINKNVVLPLVFGIIIIAFSFLLFNFISINTTKKQKRIELQSGKILTNNNLKISKKELHIVAAPIKKDSLLNIDSLALAIDQTAAIQPTNTTINSEQIETKQPIANSTTVSGKPINIPNGQNLYPEPSIKTTPIATSNNKTKYTQIGETVYFIKIIYSYNGQTTEAYLRKSSLEAKPTMQLGGRKKNTPENLESSPMPSLIDNNQNKELELR